MISLPTEGGICKSCSDNADCPMPEILKEWKDVKELYSPNEVPDYVFDESYIDEPDFENGFVIWCPMHFGES